MRLVFAGTPEFARAALESLQAAGHEIALVLTQPDRPAGRGLQLQASPVKAYAAAHGMPVAQPRSLRLDGKFADDAALAATAIHAAAADAMVVAAYGLILPAWVLAVPRLGCLNIHASLLPRWRGAAPIHRAIEAGDPETGITIMQMDAGLDTGAMLAAEPVAISPTDTTGGLHDRLAALGGRMIVTTLADAGGGALQPAPQPVEGVTYAHKIAKTEAAIDWHETATTIERRLRAFDPFPGASTVLAGEVLKCWRGEVLAGEGPAGTVLSADDAGITVACGEAALRLTELQRPGGKRLSAKQFLQGRGIVPSTILGPATT